MAVFSKASGVCAMEIWSIDAFGLRAFDHD